MLQRAEIDAVLEAFMAKDLEAVMRHFANDAVFIDPHYPQPRMQGHAAIRRGLAWGLGNAVQLGFSVRHLLISGDNAALEVDTHHVFKGGVVMRFDQMFMIETQAVKIRRLQAYVPYAPPGLAGLAPRLTRWAWRLQGLR
jgi:ketosteroid isomerase-like protein